MRRLSVQAFLLLGVLCLVISHAGAESKLLSLGQKQLDEGQFEKAALTLNTALERDGDSPRLRYLLGRAYYEQRNFDEAVKQLERAVQGEMLNSMVHLWLGRAYGRKADRDRSFSLGRKTKREFEEAVRLNPSNVQARRDLMEYYAEAPWIVGGSKDKARAQVEAIAALDRIEGHHARAEYWLKTKKPQLAEAELRKAVDAKPRRPDAYFDLAEFYRKRGRFAEMEPVIRMAIERHSSDRRVPYFAAVSEIVNDKQLDEAQKLLEKYIADPVGVDDPSRAEAHTWLGRLYEKRKHPTQAEGEYRKALQLEPDSKEAKEALGKLRKKD